MKLSARTNTTCGFYLARRPASRRCKPGPSDSRRPTVAAKARLPGEHEDEGPGAVLSEAEEQRLVSFMTYTGITGTAALLGARLAGMDVFASLQWRMSDFSYALWACLPIVLLDALVLLPKYHSRTTPSDSTEESSKEQLQRLRADLLPGAGAIAGIRATSTLFQVVAGGVEEKSLLSKPARVSLELTYLCLRDFTSELLQRGLIVSFVGAWLRDRAFEAGVDDVAFSVPDPFFGGQLPVYTSEFAMSTAGALIITLVLPAVASQANATRAAVASCAAFVVVQGEQTDEKMDSWLLEWRMIEALAIQETSLPARAAYAITFIRGYIRTSLLTAVFINTHGNLSASLIVALVSDALLFACCEQGRGSLPSLKALDSKK